MRPKRCSGLHLKDYFNYRWTSCHTVHPGHQPSTCHLLPAAGHRFCVSTSRCVPPVGLWIPGPQGPCLSPPCNPPPKHSCPWLISHLSIQRGCLRGAPKGKRREARPLPQAHLFSKGKEGLAALSLSFCLTRCAFIYQVPTTPPATGIWVFASLNRLRVPERPGLGPDHFHIPHILWADGWHAVAIE